MSGHREDFVSHEANEAAFWRRAAAVCERNCQPIRAQMFKNLAYELEQEAELVPVREMGAESKQRPGEDIH